MDRFYEADIAELLRNNSLAVYENIPVYDDDDFAIRLATVTDDGVFMIIPKRENFRDDIDCISRKFYTGQSACIFLTGNQNVYYFDHGKLILIDDLYLSFKGMYEAVTSGWFSLKSHAVHEGDLDVTDILYLKKDVFDYKEHDPLYSEDKMRVIETAFSQASMAVQESVKNPFSRRVEKQVDGNTYVQHYDKFWREDWCLVDESYDADEHERLAAFFGFLGIHKLKEGHFVSWLLYPLCFFGCFGLLPAIDCFSMISGTYRLKNGNYLPKIKNLKTAAMNLLVTAAVGIALLFGTRTALGAITSGWANSQTQKIESEIDGMTEEELLDYYTDMLEQFGFSEDEINATLEELEEYDDAEDITDTLEGEFSEAAQDYTEESSDTIQDNTLSTDSVQNEEEE